VAPEALRKDPGVAITHGIDVSTFQGSIDWALDRIISLLEAQVQPTVP
jgi:GH25 family lysozyme M1 (1,4-beta-N-acetylmuramidase)